MGHVDAPKIKHLAMIDDHRLEIYWDQEVVHKELNTAYCLMVGGRSLAYQTNTDPNAEDWDVRPVYEPLKKRTTLYVLERVTTDMLGKLTLLITGEICNEFGACADRKQRRLVRHLETFYTLFTKAESGIMIKSSGEVSREAHRQAAKIIDIMLEQIPEVAEAMLKRNAELAIYGKNEDAYDIPEHRGGAAALGRPVEGFGGCKENPVTSISDKNVLRITEGPNQTRYLNENILVHEFAHGIHLVGINHLANQELAQEIRGAYEEAKKAGRWPNTYIISNYEEYFATLSTIWFNVMAESADGTWDGVRGPLNTRAELRIYDPRGYALFEKIYPAVPLPYPWNETPVFYPNALAALTGAAVQK